MRAGPHGGPGTNILLIGTDGRGGGAPGTHRTGCDCAAMPLLLLHVSEDHDRVAAVALPPGSRSPAARRPAARGVEDLARVTHVRVDRYAQLDVPRFTAAVDALHGVEVCTAGPPRDPARGRRLLNGAEALRYVSARGPAAAGEADRVRRQQRFLAAVLHRLGTEGVLDSPVRVARLGRVLLGAARGDGRLTVPELVTLAGVVRRVGTGGTEFASAGVRWDGPRAATVFGRLRTDRPLTGTAPNTGPGAPPPLRGTALDCP
ncbi:LCP family protein [Streptomyces sp. TS71-3]|uniref:LCP family protein n=1 Tax=Streptomyces sp. TS71-3 TaxID=2733862 RepID=UPI001BB35F2A|nr:LCP family protein [Streptomyces sp. TS71-3]